MITFSVTSHNNAIHPAPNTLAFRRAAERVQLTLLSTHFFYGEVQINMATYEIGGFGNMLIGYILIYK